MLDYRFFGTFISPLVVGLIRTSEPQMTSAIAIIALMLLFWGFAKVCWQTPPKHGLYNDEPNLRPVKDDIFNTSPGPETSFEEFIPKRRKLIRLLLALLVFVGISIYVAMFLYQGVFR